LCCFLTVFRKNFQLAFPRMRKSDIGHNNSPSLLTHLYPSFLPQYKAQQSSKTTFCSNKTQAGANSHHESHEWIHSSSTSSRAGLRLLASHRNILFTNRRNLAFSSPWRVFSRSSNGLASRKGDLVMRFPGRSGAWLVVCRMYSTEGGRFHIPSLEKNLELCFPRARRSD
jgi:hypothetical protein